MPSRRSAASRRTLRGHLRTGFVTFELETVRIVDRGAGLNAQKRVVRLCVFAMGVVRIVGGDQWCADAPRYADQSGIGAALLHQAVVLQFDEQVPPPEDVL
jgi:hypothetical protein